MSNIFDQMKSVGYERLFLDKLHVYQYQKMPPYIFGDSRFVVTRTAEDLTLCLMDTVAAMSVEITPASWWQHFKRDVMPQWFTKHWPVKYVETKVVVTCEPGRVLQGGSRFELVTTPHAGQHKNFR